MVVSSSGGGADDALAFRSLCAQAFDHLSERDPRVTKVDKVGRVEL